LGKQFRQITWDEQLQSDWLALVRLALREDLAEDGDWTTRALVPAGALGRAVVVARQPGVIAGLPGAAAALRHLDAGLRWSPRLEDGQAVRAGDRVTEVEGPTASLLAAERLVLNLLGHLSGIATLARRYVDAVAGTAARIYDTRKTTPGWRRLEKYAVRCGGGWNHRTGLFEAVLIKDNHLAAGAAGPAGGSRYTPAEAVRKAHRFIAEHAPVPLRDSMIVEVEVDTLEQLEEVLPAGPDIVLLDNMDPARLREAVRRRNARGPQVELEASGGVHLETVRAIAESGVERISVGALTHSATALDIGLDWLRRDVAER
jgi:nicotinate-nucleotide pyrophosphorylase (carboxylating)